MVKRGLGKGFEALISTDLADFSSSDTEKTSDLREIELSDIQRNPNQPRRQFDESSLAQLADSVREHGILQPLILVPIQDGKYEIVAGERRFRAAKLAGLHRVPAIIRTLSEQHKAELSLIENVQRADLNPLEIAGAFATLRDDFGLSHAEIAQRVGKNVATISNILRLLDLPTPARQALVSGDISEGHARQILALPGATARAELLRQIRQNKWSVRKAEQFVLGYKSEQAAKAGTVKVAKNVQNATAEHTELTDVIARQIGLPDKQISQKITAHGGEIRIKFHDEKDLLKIRQLFNK